MPTRILTTVATIGLFWIPASVHADEPPPANEPDSCHISFAPPDDSPESQRLVKENEQKEARCEIINRASADRFSAWLTVYYQRGADFNDKDIALVDALAGRVKAMNETATSVPQPAAVAPDRGLRQYASSTVAPSPSPRVSPGSRALAEYGALRTVHVGETASLIVAVMGTSRGKLITASCDASPDSLAVFNVGRVTPETAKVIDKQARLDQRRHDYTCYAVTFKVQSATVTEDGSALVAATLVRVEATAKRKKVDPAGMSAD